MFRLGAAQLQCIEWSPAILRGSTPSFEDWRLPFPALRWGHLRHLLAPTCPFLLVLSTLLLPFYPVLLSFSLDENRRSAGENRHIEFGAALTFGLGRAGFSGDALVLFRGKKGAVPCQGGRGGKRGDRVNSWNRQTGHARSRPGPSVNAHISIGGVPRLPGLSRCHRRWLFPRPACTPQQPFRPSARAESNKGPLGTT